jgi:protein-tyrosine phosphatase
MHLLVVCTANIARSPLAGAMLAASLEDHGIEVVSAGTHARHGDPAAEPSQRMAEHRGLDLSEHRSQPVTESLVREAGLVVTMSERHRDRCAPLAAGAGAYVFTLRELGRLLAQVDRDGLPSGVADRLGWLADQAHLARPRASPPPGPEDIHDPIRDPEVAWVRMAAALDDGCGELVHALALPLGWRPALVTEQPAAPADEPAGPGARWLRSIGLGGDGRRRPRRRAGPSEEDPRA